MHINVHDLKPGMFLSKDVYTSQNRILQKSGTEITEQNIMLYKKWNVPFVEVMDDSDENKNMDNIPEECKEKAYRLNLNFFSQVDKNNNVMKHIFDFSTQRIAKQIYEKKIFECLPDMSLIKQVDLMEDKKALNVKTIQTILDDKEFNLSTSPEIIIKLTEILKNPKSSNSDISNVIQQDPTLSSKVLKLVNSPYYGFSKKVVTITNAVHILGIVNITQLIMGISVINMFKNIPSNCISPKQFWMHSLATAIIASQIVSHMKITTVTNEEIFVCGLLHDIGRIMVFNYMPKEMLYCMANAIKNKISLSSSEKVVLGYTHTNAGSKIAQKWKLPTNIELAIKFHDDPSAASYTTPVTIVHVANFLANAFKIGTSGEIFVPNLNIHAWEEQIKLDVNAIPDIISTSESQLKIVERMFFGD